LCQAKLLLVAQEHPQAAETKVFQPSLKAAEALLDGEPEPFPTADQAPLNEGVGQPSKGVSPSFREKPQERTPSQLYKSIGGSIIIESEHAQHRKATAAAWAELLPKLVYPLMKWMAGEREAPRSRLNCNCTRQERKVNVISFACKIFSSPSSTLQPLFDKWVLAISQVSVSHCKHLPPSVALLRIGAFSSTPVRPPKWAFSIKLLDFMSKQFTFGTPDVTAWCNATSSFLSSEGIEKVPSPVRQSL